MDWFPPVTSYMHYKWTESMTMKVLYVSSTTYGLVSTRDVMHALEVDRIYDHESIICFFDHI